MLDLLDVREGHRVLEIGTGTGWNAGLLTHRVGADLVSTVEIDPVLSACAARSLNAVGLEPHVICGDGAFGDWSRHPFDRVIATCAVRSVPAPWISQTAPGGVVLLPWDAPWFCFGLLRLVVDENGTASGPFFPHSAFMLMRQQRTDLRIYRDVVRDDHVPTESHTEVDPRWLAGGNWDGMFALGLLMPKVWHTWQDDPKVDGVVQRLWLATTDASSWAAVDWDGTRRDRFTVWQHGPLNLWDMAEAAWLWWCNAGKPGPERFGMSVSLHGTHAPWLDTPDRPLPCW
jgi:SAM-dependent methyltransferase